MNNFPACVCERNFMRRLPAQQYSLNHANNSVLCARRSAPPPQPRPHTPPRDSLPTSGHAQKIAWWSAGVGLAVVIGVGIASKEWILEEYYLYKLKHGNAEERSVAGEKLWEMRSVKAIPELEDWCIEELDKPREEGEKAAARKLREIGTAKTVPQLSPG